MKLVIIIKKKLIAIAKKNKIKINIFGLPAVINFSVEDDDNNIIKTFIAQEMLKKGFIFNSAIYLCTHHNKKF